jgi:kynureninase
MTPEDAQGAQLSLKVEGASKQVFHALSDHGVVGDFRPPDVIRVAPVPLYNTCSEVVSFVEILGDVLDNG